MLHPLVKLMLTFDDHLLFLPQEFLLSHFILQEELLSFFLSLRILKSWFDLIHLLFLKIIPPSFDRVLFLICCLCKSCVIYLSAKYLFHIRKCILYTGLDFSMINHESIALLLFTNSTDMFLSYNAS